MSVYEPSAQLKQSVEKGDVAFVREVLQALLNNNAYPDNEIRLALDWTAAKLPGLFDACKPDIEPFRKQSSDWNADYYYIQKATLWDDFSRERFEHLIAIRDSLRARGTPEFRYCGPGQKMHGQLPSSNKTAEGGTSGQPLEGKLNIPWGYVAVALCAIGVCALVGAVIIKRLR